MDLGTTITAHTTMVTVHGTTPITTAITMDTTMDITMEYIIQQLHVMSIEDQEVA